MDNNLKFPLKSKGNHYIIEEQQNFFGDVFIWQTEIETNTAADLRKNLVSVQGRAGIAILPKVGQQLLHGNTLSIEAPGSKIGYSTGNILPSAERRHRCLARPNGIRYILSAVPRRGENPARIVQLIKCS